jgi:hypothetical protein
MIRDASVSKPALKASSILTTKLNHRVRASCEDLDALRRRAGERESKR